MAKRVVLYARVSGDDRGRDGRNLNGQLEMCRNYAEARNWRVIAELAEDDRGASGASFELPKLNQVLEMARSGDFDVVVVREIDRLSRKLAKQLIVEEELKRYGVQLEYVLGDYPDSPEGNLMKNVRATIAEYEREKIKERMVRGRRQRVKAGSVMMHGHVPFGYRQSEVDGKQVLVIHEEEAETVRMIFAWYIQGKSLRSIARKLSEMGILTYTDKKENWHVKKRPVGSWSMVTVREMLFNETYAGVWRYGAEQIPVSVPAIIDRKTWKAAQAQAEKNKQNSSRSLKYDYLLRRRTTCGACGVKMRTQSRRSNGKLYLYYRCPANYRGLYAHDCDLPSFRADKVDAVVWEWICACLSDLETLQEGLEAEQADRERQLAPMRARLEVVEDLLSDNKAQLARLLDLYLVGEMPKELLIERKKRLEATIKALETEGANLASYLQETMLTAEQAASITDFAAEIAEGLDEAEDLFAAKVRIIELLDVRATMAVEDEEKVIYVWCMLGEDVLSLEFNSTVFDRMSRDR